MTGYRHTTIAAAGAAFLAATPLAAVFRSYSWAIYAIGAVTVVLAAVLVTRGMRLPVWAQIGSMLGAHTVLLGWLFGGGTMLLGVIPTPSTIARFWQLLESAGDDVRELAAPVPDTDGLLFTVTASIGLVAVLVDLVAVTLRQPALAGLPMLAIYSVPVAVLADSVSWVPFGFAAAGFMWLLAADNVGRVRGWGRRFADDGRDVDAWEGSPLAAAGRRLGLVGIAAAVLIPLAVPEMTAGFLERLINGTGFSGGAGLTGGRSIDPWVGLKGNLDRKDNLVLLRIATQDPQPGYLRLAVADRITEEGALPSRRSPDRKLPDGLYPLDRVPASGRAWRADVDVVDLRQDYLPFYATTDRIALTDDDHWSYDIDKSVIWSEGGATDDDLAYQLTYRTPEYTVGQLQGARSPNNTIMGEFTQVPRNQAVEALVARLTKDQDNQYDKVMAIYRHFSRKNGFSYSLNVGNGSSSNDIENFLNAKKGFCQQYAVAMTWMLRTANIPARVAIGFTQGKVRSNGFEIGSGNAHAWVEVDFAGVGWVPFDPTPAPSVVNSVQMSWAPNPYDPPDPSPSASAAPDSSATASTSPTRGDNRDPGQDASAAAGGPSDPPARWPYWLFSGLLVVALLAAPGARRWLVRRRRLRMAGRGDDPATAAYAAWDELLDTLVDLDIAYQSSDTPRGVVRRLREIRPPLIETSVTEIGLLASAVEQARYAPAPLPGVDLQQAASSVASELRLTATRQQRIRATTLPGSVIRDWREFLTGTWEQMLDAWQRWRDEVARTRQARKLKERTTFR
ncbi:MAG TPA: DUF3488 and transglutaminase-like domain-containing protein [Micromonosporaceae bacterium]|jgi:transglutaminase-like putative cysteine protease|nr:DUF3488 and transglutaminase-like domain-containing protein [Micromonosporaceae bacterium]